MPHFTPGAPFYCRDCGNRTKQVRHGIAWCLIDCVPIPLGLPSACQAFMARDGTELPSGPSIVFPSEKKRQQR